MSEIKDAEPRTLRESIDALRAIPAKWKHLKDPIGDLQRIRYDPDFNPWDDPEWAEKMTCCTHSSMPAGHANACCVHGDVAALKAVDQK